MNDETDARAADVRRRIDRLKEEASMNDDQQSGNAPAGQPQLVIEDDQMRRSRQVIASHAEAKANPRDVAPNGGKYLVGGVLVDANGQPVAERRP